MEEQLISFETSKLAKEKGFESDVSHSIYTEIGELKDPIAQMDLMRNQESIQEYFKLIKSFPSAPTQSLLQKWLREFHNIYVESYHDLTADGKGIRFYTNWGFIQQKDIDGNQNVNGWYDEYNDWKTYEEALEFGLHEGLKLIPQPK